MELIFFTATSKVLCFRSATKTVLVTQSFSCCWAVLAQGQGLLCFPLYEPSSHLGLGKRMTGHTARTADLNRLKKYSTPYNATLSNKTGGGVVPKQLLLGNWLGIGLLESDCLCFFFLICLTNCTYINAFVLSLLSPILMQELSKQQSSTECDSHGQPTRRLNCIFHC